MTRHIRVLWYSSPSLLSRVIRRATRSRFSHVAIEVDGCVYEALGRGIVVRSGPDAERRRAEAVSWTTLPVTPNEALQVEVWLSGKVGRGYSLLGFLAAGLTALGLPVPVVALKHEYICSGLAATAIQIAGYIPLSEARLETPQSLWELLNPEVA